MAIMKKRKGGTIFVLADPHFRNGAIHDIKFTT